MLLFIKFSAERPKRSRKGEDIPGTFVGAVSSANLYPSLSFTRPPMQSQLKKLFFGALRIRKEQEAHNKELHQRRPATSVTVWDAIKNRMDESLEHVQR